MRSTNMKNERYQTRLGMLMAAAAASLLIACATEADRLTPSESTTTDEGASVTGADINVGAIDSAMNPAVGAVPAQSSSCRRVTASSIPVYATASGSTVNCRFLKGDFFTILGSTNAGGGRYLSWCPRHTPIDQGVLSWAQAAGTVAAACPF
jgi:hypothetical protein